MKSIKKVNDIVNQKSDANQETTITRARVQTNDETKNGM